jgi:hypothetical protein
LIQQIWTSKTHLFVVVTCTLNEIVSRWFFILISHNISQLFDIIVWHRVLSFLFV